MGTSGPGLRLDGSARRKGRAALYRHGSALLKSYCSLGKGYSARFNQLFCRRSRRSCDCGLRCAKPTTAAGNRFEVNSGRWLAKVRRKRCAIRVYMGRHPTTIRKARMSTGLSATSRGVLSRKMGKPERRCCPLETAMAQAVQRQRGR